MIAYLIRYSSTNSEAYKLVYANSENEAIDLCKEQLFYLTNLLVQSATINPPK